MVNKPKLTVEEIAGMLGKTVGDHKAMTAVRAACDGLGIDTARGITHEEAIEVLEVIAGEPGIVGVTARFAKSRLHLATLNR